MSRNILDRTTDAPENVLEACWINAKVSNHPREIPFMSTGGARFASESTFLCTLPFGSEALVVSHEIGEVDVLVLCCGRLGWIRPEDIDKAAPVVTWVQTDATTV